MISSKQKLREIVTIPQVQNLGGGDSEKYDQDMLHLMNHVKLTGMLKKKTSYSKSYYFDQLLRQKKGEKDKIPCIAGLKIDSILGGTIDSKRHHMLVLAVTCEPIQMYNL
ncbi:hypothetical protein VNO77_12833 [Canavalia gladiata]|uniref:Uncharacterized protein n=1 Tax=Canavalia gladiata TaxID=3824 RepID=A0AAN9M168_CANGL